jgi:hypothetical protein
MKSRSAEDERRSGTYWLNIAVFDLAAMSAMWWLVERTTEGEHDAQLLPLLALIPLLIGLYRVVHSRCVRMRSEGRRDRSEHGATDPDVDRGGSQRV